MIHETEAEHFATRFQGIVREIERVIKGKEDVIRFSLIALLAEGHVLLEDVPGTGKTSLARTLSRVLGLDSQRVQCTPDLLPSDITGISIYHPKDESFVFHPGPAFTNILIADEINRATPRTQSALLEVMQEGTVTIDGSPRSVPRPFLVIATQNPHEMSGTYVLPEAQLDRFMMRLSMGYPSRDAELDIVEADASSDVRITSSLLDPDEILHLISIAANVFVSRAAARYAVDIVRATREHPEIRLGASPRAGISLVKAAKALAVSNGRNHVLPQDIEAMCFPVLNHRLTTSSRRQNFGVNDIAGLLEDLIAATPIPLEIAK